MSAYRFVRGLLLLWLGVSFVGVLAPVWGLAGILYLVVQRGRSKADVRRLAKLLNSSNKE